MSSHASHLTSNNNTSGSYDNYNHFSGSSSPITNGTKFYGSNGSTAIVTTNNSGSQSITLQEVGSNGSPITTLFTQSSTNSKTFQSKTHGITATIINVNGEPTIDIVLSNGTKETFTQHMPINDPSKNSSQKTTSSQYFGSTGSPIQTSQHSLAYQSNNGSSSNKHGSHGSSSNKHSSHGSSHHGSHGSSSHHGGHGSSSHHGGHGSSSHHGGHGSSSHHGGHSSSSHHGGHDSHSDMFSHHNTSNKANKKLHLSGSQYNSNNSYSSTLPDGIPGSQIPLGQEDLYILKSQVVPPVCPACPNCLSMANNSNSSTSSKKEKCPPCPSCARCPEPSFECKKVPNYSSINNDYLPSPVLNDFSQFGM
jgi:hypothetical protein